MTIEMLKRAIEVGGESAIVLLFRSFASIGKIHEDRLPFDTSIDKLDCDIDLPHSRVDLVITHADGSLIAIVARDGDSGHGYVATRIGEASICTTQLALVLPGTTIRNSLPWTSTGSLLLDVLIEDACVAANVSSFSWATMATHLTTTARLLNIVYSGAGNASDVRPEAKGLVH